MGGRLCALSRCILHLLAEESDGRGLMFPLR
jgi:hypothetical protein